MTSSIMRAAVAAVFVASLVAQPAMASPAAPLGIGAKSSIEQTAGRRFSGGGRGGYRGGYRGGGGRGGWIAGGIGAAIIGGVLVNEYYGNGYYSSRGYSCSSLEYRCDHGSEWACRRLDHDPRC